MQASTTTYPGLAMDTLAQLKRNKDNFQHQALDAKRGDDKSSSLKKAQKFEQLASIIEKEIPPALQEQIKNATSLEQKQTALIQLFKTCNAQDVTEVAPYFTPPSKDLDQIAHALLLKVQAEPATLQPTLDAFLLLNADSKPWLLDKYLHNIAMRRSPEKPTEIKAMLVNPDFIPILSENDKIKQICQAGIRQIETEKMSCTTDEQVKHFQETTNLLNRSFVSSEVKDGNTLLITVLKAYKASCKFFQSTDLKAKIDRYLTGTLPLAALAEEAKAHIKFNAYLSTALWVATKIEDPAAKVRIPNISFVVTADDLSRLKGASLSPVAAERSTTPFATAMEIEGAARSAPSPARSFTP